MIPHVSAKSFGTIRIENFVCTVRNLRKTWTMFSSTIANNTHGILRARVHKGILGS